MSYLSVLFKELAVRGLFGHKLAFTVYMDGSLSEFIAKVFTKNGTYANLSWDMLKNQLRR